MKRSHKRIPLLFVKPDAVVIQILIVFIRACYAGIRIPYPHIRKPFFKFPI